MEQTIHITGASGSGTSTLGRALAARLSLLHLDTDDFLWLPSRPPYQEKRPVADRLRLLYDATANQPGWVLSGSLDGWGETFVPAFDLVIFLFTPTPVRLKRLRKRELQRHGAPALMPGGNMHAAHESFMTWAAAYDHGFDVSRNYHRHLAWLNSLSCPVLRLDGTHPPSALVNSVMAELIWPIPAIGHRAQHQRLS